MKKILKSILIATTSIGALSGSVAAVVSCGSNSPTPTVSENQKKYNDAVELVKGKIGTGDSSILSTLNILVGTTDFSQVATDLQSQIDSMISHNDSIKDILGAVTIKAPATAFDVTTAGALVLTSMSGVTMSIASDLTDVSVPSPIGISIKYKVVDNAQYQYDNAVKAIMTTINTQASAATNAVVMGTTKQEIETHLFELINNAIPEHDALVDRFTNPTEILGLASSAQAIFEKSKAIASGQTILITGLNFKPKNGSVSDPKSFYYDYYVTYSENDYNAQVKTVLDNIGTSAAKLSFSFQDDQTKIQTKVMAAINDYITKNKATLPAIDVITDVGAITYSGTIDTSNVDGVTSATHAFSISIPRTPVGAHITVTPVTRTFTYDVSPSVQHVYHDYINSPTIWGTSSLPSGSFTLAEYIKIAKQVGIDTNARYVDADGMGLINGKDKPLFIKFAKALMQNYYESAPNLLPADFQEIIGLLSSDFILDINCVAASLGRDAGSPGWDQGDSFTVSVKFASAEGATPEFTGNGFDLRFGALK